MGSITRTPQKTGTTTRSEEASSVKEVGQRKNSDLVSIGVPVRHHNHINFRGVFADLCAFILWREQWGHGKAIL